MPLHKPKPHRDLGIEARIAQDANAIPVGVVLRIAHHPRASAEFSKNSPMHLSGIESRGMVQQDMSHLVRNNHDQCAVVESREIRAANLDQLIVGVGQQAVIRQQFCADPAGGDGAQIANDPLPTRDQFQPNRLVRR